MQTITPEELKARGWKEELSNRGRVSFGKDISFSYSLWITFDDGRLSGVYLNYKHIERSCDTAPYVKTEYIRLRYTTFEQIDAQVALLTGKEQGCFWHFNADDEWWETNCGEIEDNERLLDGLDETHYKYCPYCGKRIVVKEQDGG